MRLASANGGLVRTHDDSTTELLTHEHGGVRRYTIREAGEVELVDAGAATGGYARGGRLMFAGMLLSLGTVGLAFLVVIAGRFVFGETPPIPSLAGVALFIIGVVAFGVGSIMASVALPVAGEEWSRLAGPDH